MTCLLIGIGSLAILLFLLSKLVEPLLIGYWLVSISKQSLPSDAVRVLSDSAGTHLVQEGEIERISAVCSIDEGPHCWYEAEEPSREFSQEASKAIVAGIGMQRIEHTPDNIAYIRCSRPIVAPDQVTCEVRLTADWSPIDVE